MKDKLADLNTHLFAELDRLGKEDLVLDKEKLDNEALRARAICGVSMQILACGHLKSKAYDMADGSFGKKKLPEFFMEEERDSSTLKITHKPLLLRKNA
jgi:hypothetical protein